MSLYIIEVLTASLAEIIETRSPPHLEYKPQPSVYSCWSCLLCSHTADRSQTVMQKLFAACIGKPECTTIPAPSWKSASMEHQWLLVLYLGWSGRGQVADSRKWWIGCHYCNKRKQISPRPILKLRIKGALPIVGLGPWLLTVQYGCYCRQTSLILFLYA
jgi:hypothetical protein